MVCNFNGYRQYLCTGLGILAIVSAKINANISVPFFNDHMVLQRQILAPVFGKADAGETITVSFRGQTKTATADAGGKWMVKLDPTEAGGPFELVLKGKNTVTITDVLVGEVWLGSGQSNMEMSMSGAVLADSAKSADYPQVRMMGVGSTNGAWRVCTPANVLPISAVGYFFARDLQLALKVPVGIIISAVGGTEVERWLEPDFISKDTALSNPAFRTQNVMPGDLYNSKILPIVPMALRGVLWYQGESNEGNAKFYLNRFAGLIKGWRKVFNEPALHFYFIQLASYRTLQTIPVESNGWCDIREAQRLSLALPNTAMATAIDIGEAGDIHPKNKWDLGRRLALSARALVHGEKSLVHSGPMFKAHTVEGSKFRLEFDQVGGGLLAKGGAELKGFAIAGSDDKWVWANAVIDKGSLLVSAPTVSAPTQVRYSWAANPIGNLINKEGLPASSFKTDGAQLPVAVKGVEPQVNKSFLGLRWFRIRDLRGRRF
jgi:sialate O-acetylesterase